MTEIKKPFPVIQQELIEVSKKIPSLLPLQKATALANTRNYFGLDDDPNDVDALLRISGKAYGGHFTRNWMTGIDPALAQAGLPTYNQFLSEVAQDGSFVTKLAPWRQTYQSPFNDPNCLLDLYLERVVAKADIPSRREFTKGVVGAVKTQSTENKRKVFESKNRTAEFDTIVVGGGPVGNTAVVNIGPTQKTAYITSDPWHGYSWYSRANLTMNSSFDQFDPYGDPLPILEGATTKLLLNLLDLNRVAARSADSRTVACEVGTRSYAGGETAGVTNLINAAASTPHLFTRTELSYPSIAESDKKVFAVARDLDSGQSFQLNAEKLYIASGPGAEECKVADVESRDDYANAQRLLRDQLTGEAKKIDFPKLSNLQMLGDALVYWIQNCNADPALYPFDFFDINARVSVLGDGDAAISVWKFLGGLAPESAYPPGFKELLAKPQRRWLGFNRAKDLTQLPRQLNKNIDDVTFQRSAYEADLVVPGRVTAHRAIDRNNRSIGVQSIVAGASFIDNYTFVCTGLTDSKSEDRIENVSFNDATLANNPDFILGRQSDLGRVQILGLANKFPREKLPPPFREYLNTLGVDQKGNLAALWVWQYLSQVQVLQDMQTNKVNKKVFDTALQFDPYKLVT